ncbi:MAG: Hfq-like protein [Acidobacteriaceae bacterium]
MPKIPRENPVPIAVNPPKNKPSVARTHEESVGEADGKVEAIDSGFAGQRKLIRPVLPENASVGRDPRRRGFRGIWTRRDTSQPAPSVPDGTQAEGFYLQKQIQAQTPMVFVLDDGEQIEGCIEWYDRSCIKVRNSSRVLVYKSSIKYLYKASERQGDGPMI